MRPTWPAGSARVKAVGHPASILDVRGDRPRPMTPTTPATSRPRVPPPREPRGVRPGLPGDPRRGEQPGAGLRRGRRRAAVHGPGRGAVPLRHRRPPIHRLHRLVGADDPRPRAIPQVRAAVVEALELGSSFGRPTVREVEIAEAVVAAVPSIEKVRFVSSGTEAAMSAVRLARGRHRPRQDRQDGRPLPRPRRRPARPGRLGRDDARDAQQPGRHRGRDGRHDPLPVQRRRRPWPTPSRRFPGQIAAVLLEPVAGNMGLVPPRPGYLETLRELTEKHGALARLRRGDDRLPRWPTAAPRSGSASRPT